MIDELGNLLEPCISERTESAWHLLMRVHDHIWRDKEWSLRTRMESCHSLNKLITDLYIGNTHELRLRAESVLGDRGKPNIYHRVNSDMYERMRSAAQRRRV